MKMPEPFVRLNDGGTQMPRLRVGIALSSLSGLPLGGASWNLEQKLERVRESGFEHLECRLHDEAGDEAARVVERFGLRLAIRHRAEHIGHVRDAVRRAVDLGADYVVLEVAHTRDAADEAQALLLDGPGYARDHGVPLWIHTCRATATETLHDTQEMIDCVPALRFACDLAEYFVAGEWGATPREALPSRLAPILTRTSHLYGRVSDGQAIQVDIGDGRGHFARAFVDLWSIAMRAWIQGAYRGDVLPFTCHLPARADAARPNRRPWPRMERPLDAKPAASTDGRGRLGLRAKRNQRRNALYLRLKSICGWKAFAAGKPSPGFARTGRLM